MPRRVYLLGLGLTLVALGLAFTDWALSLRPGVTERNVRRIREGMTLPEVEALFGGCARTEFDIHAACRQTPGACYPTRWWTRSAWRRDWQGVEGTVTVTFGLDGTVTETAFERSDRPSSFARLRAWLGW